MVCLCRPGGGRCLRRSLTYHMLNRVGADNYVRVRCGRPDPASCYRRDPHPEGGSPNALDVVPGPVPIC